MIQLIQAIAILGDDFWLVLYSVRMAGIEGDSLEKGRVQVVPSEENLDDDEQPSEWDHSEDIDERPVEGARDDCG